MRAGLLQDDRLTLRGLTSRACILDVYSSHFRVISASELLYDHVHIFHGIVIDGYG